VRDNASLTRPAWIEADLERIFTEERYADFAALWLLIHETRFGKRRQPRRRSAPWRSGARPGAKKARAPASTCAAASRTRSSPWGRASSPTRTTPALRAALQDGTLTPRTFFNQLLRLVYRLIFLLTVEERDLLHPDGHRDAAKSSTPRATACAACASAPSETQRPRPALRPVGGG
jgi:hypothetical protein